MGLLKSRIVRTVFCLFVFSASNIFAYDCPSLEGSLYTLNIYNIRKSMGDEYANNLLLECAAADDSANLASIVGEDYESGTDGFEKNSTKSLFWLKKAAIWGNKDAKDLLAYAYIRRGDYKLALYWSKLSLGSDWRVVCSKYPYKEFDDYMPTTAPVDEEGDFTTAEEKCRTLTEASVGFLDQVYSTHFSELTNNLKALYLFTHKLADLGSVHAQMYMAYILMHLKDSGSKTCPEAMKYYNMALNNYPAKKTKLDTARIYYGLATCYKKLNMYGQANQYNYYLARMGYIAPMLELAQTYANGLGVPQNFVKAYGWSSIVKSLSYNHDWEKNEFQQSSSLLVKLSKQMTPDEIARAQEYASKLYGT